MANHLDEGSPISTPGAEAGREGEGQSDGPIDLIARYDRLGLLSEDLDENDDTDQIIPSMLLLGVALSPLAREPLLRIAVTGKNRPIQLSRDRDGWIAQWGPLGE